VIIDGRLRWRAKDLEWELFDAATGTYRIEISSDDIPKFFDQIVGSINVTGTFKHRDKTYSLIPYRSLDRLRSEEERFDYGFFYAGPGTHIHQISDEHWAIYVRLQSPDPNVVLSNQNTFAKTLERLDPNSESVALEIAIDNNGRGSCFAFRELRTSFHIEGITLNNFTGTIFSLQNAGYFNALTLKDLEVNSPGLFLRVGAVGDVLNTGELYASKNILVENVQVNQFLSPWISFDDAKSGGNVGGIFRAIEIMNGAHNVTIRNCVFKNMWDGIYVGSTKIASTQHNQEQEPIFCALREVFDNVLIEHNTFENMQDDAITLIWAARGVEISHNRFLQVARCVSKQGAGSGRRAGMIGCNDPNLLPPDTRDPELFLNAAELGQVYIHHNLCILQPKFGTRLRQNVHPSGFRPYRPADAFNSTHASDGFGFSTWKIYHNTVETTITLSDFSLSMGNMPVIPTTTFGGFVMTEREFELMIEPRLRQEIYNNIFILRGDFNMFYVSIGRRWEEMIKTFIFDGNLYFNERRNARFRVGYDNYTLEEFKESDLNNTQIKAHYPLGWEYSGVEGNPCLDKDHRPLRFGLANTPGVDLSALGLRGAANHLSYRGAFSMEAF